MAMLIIFGGLPGTGKTTIAKQLARQLNAVYLRMDSIEQALRNTNPTVKEIGPEGYYVAYALVAENPSLGNTVIADSVNALNITRQAWRDTALKAQVPFVEIELMCSDPAIHQVRVQERVADIPNHLLPSWQAVMEREYEPWLTEHLVIDTAIVSIDAGVKMIQQRLTLECE